MSFLTSFVLPQSVAGPKNSSAPAINPQDNLISDSRVAADAAAKNRKKYTR